MRYQSLVPFIAALSNIVIGGLVLRRGLRDRLHRVFAWNALTIALWNLGLFSLYYFPEAADAEWWSRIFRTGICFAPVATYHFTALLVAPTQRMPRLALAGYVAASLLAVLNLRGDLVAGVNRHTWGWYIEPTPLYGLVTALICIYLPLCTERAWRAYRQGATPRQRVQAKFWFLAIGLQTPLTLTNLLPAYGINVYPLGNLGNVIFSSIVAYAIVRHRLMDVDYVVRKTVSFALAAGAVLAPGGLGIALLSRELGASEPQLVACFAVTLALLAVLLIPTLQQALETHVQRALFPHHHDHRRRMGELTAALVHLLDEGELVRRLGRSLAEIMDLDVCEVIVRDEQTRRLSVVYPETPSAEPFEEATTAPLEPITEPVLAEEARTVRTGAAVLFAARRWEAGMPLRINERLIGFVGLGQKRDFRIFTSEDLRLLAAVASAASVALENARLSRQLRRSEAVLERANRLSSLGMLAAGLAHEIRNPLVAVKTFLDLLPQRLEDREFLSHFRDLSLSELRRVTDLIADLLTLGKSSTTARKPVPLAATIEPVVRLMGSTARKRHVELVVDVRPDLPSVVADPDQLKQMVLNLLLNAIEASSAGGRVTLDIRLASGDGVAVEVGDQGPGIPDSDMQHIFDPFFTTKESGTGLGLALVHQMVVEHGGEIGVTSEPGRGTVFRLTLPAAAAELRSTGT